MSLYRKPKHIIGKTENGAESSINHQLTSDHANVLSSKVISEPILSFKPPSEPNNDKCALPHMQLLEQRQGPIADRFNHKNAPPPHNHQTPPKNASFSPFLRTSFDQPPASLEPNMPQGGDTPIISPGFHAPLPASILTQIISEYNGQLLPRLAPSHLLSPQAACAALYPISADTTLRDYQRSITYTCIHNNTLVCLPTGLGKTLIAAATLWTFFSWFPNGKCVFFAPMKPLVQQQVIATLQSTSIPICDIAMVTGDISPPKRQKLWLEKRIFFSTPQVFITDCTAGHLVPEQFTLLIFDEAHRTTGNYAYVSILDFFHNSDLFPRIVGLSATPGRDIKSINDIINKMHIERLEIRSLDHQEVRRYQFEKRVHPVIVPTNTFCSRAERDLMQIYTGFLKDLARTGVLFTADPDKVYLQTFRSATQQLHINRNRQNQQPIHISLAYLFVAQIFYSAIQLLQTYSLAMAFSHIMSYMSLASIIDAVKVESTPKTKTKSRKQSERKTADDTTATTNDNPSRTDAMSKQGQHLAHIEALNPQLVRRVKQDKWLFSKIEKMPAYISFCSNCRFGLAQSAVSARMSSQRFIMQKNFKDTLIKEQIKLQDQQMIEQEKASRLSLLLSRPIQPSCDMNDNTATHVAAFDQAAQVAADHSLVCPNCHEQLCTCPYIYTHAKLEAVSSVLCSFFLTNGNLDGAMNFSPPENPQMGPMPENAAIFDPTVFHACTKQASLLEHITNEDYHTVIELYREKLIAKKNADARAPQPPLKSSLYRPVQSSTAQTPLSQNPNMDIIQEIDETLATPTQLEASDAKVIIFTSLRASVGEILTSLKPLYPLVRPAPFIGVSNSNNGMSEILNHDAKKAGSNASKPAKNTHEPTSDNFEDEQQEIIGELASEGFFGFGFDAASLFADSAPDTEIRPPTKPSNILDQIADSQSPNHSFSLKDDFDALGLTSAEVNGMTRLEQADIIAKFKQGEYNVLIATNIVEEGIDIGEVDLILCYDSATGPIRQIQRHGRTSRKRKGTVITFLSQGGEKARYIKGVDRIKWLYNLLSEPSHFQLFNAGVDAPLPIELKQQIQPIGTDPSGSIASNNKIALPAAFFKRKNIIPSHFYVPFRYMSLSRIPVYLAQSHLLRPEHHASLISQLTMTHKRGAASAAKSRSKISDKPHDILAGILAAFDRIKLRYQTQNIPYFNITTSPSDHDDDAPPSKLDIKPRAKPSQGLLTTKDTKSSRFVTMLEQDLADDDLEEVPPPKKSRSSLLKFFPSAGSSVCSDDKTNHLNHTDHPIDIDVQIDSPASSTSSLFHSSINNASLSLTVHSLSSESSLQNACGESAPQAPMTAVDCADDPPTPKLTAVPDNLPPINLHPLAKNDDEPWFPSMRSSSFNTIQSSFQVLSHSPSQQAHAVVRVKSMPVGENITSQPVFDFQSSENNIKSPLSSRLSSSLSSGSLFSQDSLSHNDLDQELIDVERQYPSVRPPVNQPNDVFPPKRETKSRRVVIDDMAACASSQNTSLSNSSNENGSEKTLSFIVSHSDLSVISSHVTTATAKLPALLNSNQCSPQSRRKHVNNIEFTPHTMMQTPHSVVDEASEQYVAALKQRSLHFLNCQSPQFPNSVKIISQDSYDSSFVVAQTQDSEVTDQDSFIEHPLRRQHPTSDSESSTELYMLQNRKKRFKDNTTTINAAAESGNKIASNDSMSPLESSKSPLNCVSFLSPVQTNTLPDISSVHPQVPPSHNSSDENQQSPLHNLILHQSKKSQHQIQQLLTSRIATAPNLLPYKTETRNTLAPSSCPPPASPPSLAMDIDQQPSKLLQFDQDSDESLSFIPTKSMFHQPGDDDDSDLFDSSLPPPPPPKISISPKKTTPSKAPLLSRTEQARIAKRLKQLCSPPPAAAAAAAAGPAVSSKKRATRAPNASSVEESNNLTSAIETVQTGQDIAPEAFPTISRSQPILWDVSSVSSFSKHSFGDQSPCLPKFTLDPLMLPSTIPGNIVPRGYSIHRHQSIIFIDKLIATELSSLLGLLRRVQQSSIPFESLFDPHSLEHRILVSLACESSSTLPCSMGLSLGVTVPVPSLFLNGAHISISHRFGIIFASYDDLLGFVPGFDQSKETLLSSKNKKVAHNEDPSAKSKSPIKQLKQRLFIAQTFYEKVILFFVHDANNKEKIGFVAQSVQNPQKPSSSSFESPPSHSGEVFLMPVQNHDIVSSFLNEVRTMANVHIIDIHPSSDSSAQNFFTQLTKVKSLVDGAFPAIYPTGQTSPDWTFSLPVLPGLLSWSYQPLTHQFSARTNDQSQSSVRKPEASLLPSSLISPLTRDQQISQTLVLLSYLDFCCQIQDASQAQAHVLSIHQYQWLLTHCSCSPRELQLVQTAPLIWLLQQYAELHASVFSQHGTSIGLPPLFLEQASLAFLEHIFSSHKHELMFLSSILTIPIHSILRLFIAGSCSIRGALLRLEDVCSFQVQDYSFHVDTAIAMVLTQVDSQESSLPTHHIQSYLAEYIPYFFPDSSLSGGTDPITYQFDTPHPIFGITARVAKDLCFRLQHSSLDSIDDILETNQIVSSVGSNPNATDLASKIHMVTSFGQWITHVGLGKLSQHHKIKTNLVQAKSHRGKHSMTGLAQELAAFTKDLLTNRKEILQERKKAALLAKKAAASVAKRSKKTSSKQSKMKKAKSTRVSFQHATKRKDSTNDVDDDEDGAAPDQPTHTSSFELREQAQAQRYEGLSKFQLLHTDSFWDAIDAQFRQNRTYYGTEGHSSSDSE